MNKKVILLILDGWGIAKDKQVSAIDAAHTPFMNSLVDYPQTTLEASGLAVGLPAGQMGNSEVGHINIGAGRTVFQDFVKISQAIDDGSVQSNQVFQDALKYAIKAQKTIHFIGLLSDGGVHSHIHHIQGLLKYLSSMNHPNIFVHAFTDGRDTDPKKGIAYIKTLNKYMKQYGGKLATVVGRYYAMDRDKRWERIKIAYDALVHGKGKQVDDPITAITQSYEKNITDEFLLPIICTNQQESRIKPGDVVINFNFRTDRGRQITQVLTQENFEEFGMKKMELHYVTLTNYDKTFKNIRVMYEKENLTETFGEVLEKNNRTQIRIAETEKYPHVTYFFSGGREKPFVGEKRIMCPSPKVPTYDLKPEMSARDICDKILPEIHACSADFICLNFANPDMVGHTGVFTAAIKACETVDECANKIVQASLKNKYLPIITADHGNPDIMINPDGSPNTAHTTNEVPFILVNKSLKIKSILGKLGDIAPTLLFLMGIKPPDKMTGNILID